MKAMLGLGDTSDAQQWETLADFPEDHHSFSRTHREQVSTCNSNFIAYGASSGYPRPIT